MAMFKYLVIYTDGNGMQEVGFGWIDDARFEAREAARIYGHAELWCQREPFREWHFDHQPDGSVKVVRS